MPAAPQANNDVEMIEVLQVGSEEMLEATETLQRALTREREKENVGGGASFISSKGTAITPTPGATPYTDGMNNIPQLVPEGRRKTITSSESKENGTVLSLSGSGSGSESGSDGRPRDTLDREFIESGIMNLCWVGREYSPSFLLSCVLQVLKLLFQIRS